MQDGSLIPRFGRARRDPALAVLEGLHPLKHALRFDADVLEAVTDDEILSAYQFLAREESVFCEAASSASVAGLLKAGVPAGSKVVCVLTGHGLKDPDLAIKSITVPTVIEPGLSSVLAEISL